MRLAWMPKVETVIVPTYDFWGWRWGANHLRRGAGHTQRHFCGNGKAGAQPAAQEREAGLARPIGLFVSGVGIEAGLLFFFFFFFFF